MKHFALVSLATILFIGTGVAVAQEANIVHYESTKERSKRPDFSKALIAIEFKGAPAVTAKSLFLSLGAQDFNETDAPCNVNRDVICITIQTGPGQMVSGSGSSYNSGSHGGGYTSGSFSGMNYPVTIRVSLIKWNNGGMRTIIPLGESQDLAPAGTGSESIGSYSRTGSGSVTSNSTSNLDSTYDNAANKALTSLLSKNGFARFLACGQYAKWYNGADRLVQQTFRQ